MEKITFADDLQRRMPSSDAQRRGTLSVWPRNGLVPRERPKLKLTKRQRKILQTPS